MTRLQAALMAACATLCLFVSDVGAGARPECTAAQATVQSELEAACPCATAAHHADYVRCVTRKLRELSACSMGQDGTRSCGPLPRACVGKVRRVASRSACGEATTITCCRPRQHDCVGDSTPGDGKAEGTCSGSTKPCDRLADCVLPKCQLAPSAERCRLIGGTPGNGKDCATACPQ